MSNPTPSDPTPAERFERFFGPAVFSPWTRVLLDRAALEPGDRVLDLACATGIVARRAAREVGGEARVVGLDLDPEMLDVARERGTAEGVRVEWLQGDATDLDLADEAFDVLLCQQGLQFFSDPLAALRESRRVLVEDGRIALNVWQPLERHPVYAPMLEAEAGRLGAELDDVARPFTFGDAERIRGLLREAGFRDVDVQDHVLEVEFPEPDTFVALTVMAGAAVVPELAPEDEEEREALIRGVSADVGEVLARHTAGGRIRFPMPNNLAVARA